MSSLSSQWRFTMWLYMILLKILMRQTLVRPTFNEETHLELKYLRITEFYPWIIQDWNNRCCPSPRWVVTTIIIVDKRITIIKLLHHLERWYVGKLKKVFKALATFWIILSIQTFWCTCWLWYCNWYQMVTVFPLISMC